MQRNSASQFAGAAEIEDAYGHRKRLRWIRSHLLADDRIIEIGCGTGFMLCLPLALEGYDVTGIDLDVTSIEEGKRIFESIGADQSRLRAVDFSETDIHPDVSIVSEVLEHLEGDRIKDLLETIRKRMPKHGRLLVTVPNGFGWFEFESFLWNRVGLEWLARKLRVQRALDALKTRWLTRPFRYSYPSTFSDSGHIQRFTLRSIQRLLNDSGFEVFEATGTVMFAGPVSNLVFRGLEGPLAFNARLGSRFPKLAAGFLVAARTVS